VETLMVIVGSNLWGRKLSFKSAFYESMSHHLYPIPSTNIYHA